jgi:MFS superfamily sulfate permease-like transporter
LVAGFFGVLALAAGSAFVALKTNFGYTLAVAWPGFWRAVIPAMTAMLDHAIVDLFLPALLPALLRVLPWFCQA